MTEPRGHDPGEPADAAAGASPSEGGGPTRGLVPSARETAHGLDRPPGDQPPATGAAAGPPPRRSLRGLVADFDPRRIAGPKLPLLLLGLSALLASWDDVALTVLLPDMRAEFGFSLQFLLTLGSVLGVVTIILAPAMGYLADRVRRVWMLRLGGLVSNGASIAQGLAPAIPALVAARAAGGVGQAIVRPAGFPLLTDYYPSHSRARAFAFLGFMGGVGALAGPAAAGNLAGWYDWRVAVVAMGAVATLVTLGFFWLREPPRGYQDRKELGVDEATARREQSPVGWVEGWRAAASVTTLRRLWYATPFLHIGWVGVGTFLGLYFAEEFGLGPQARGYIASLQGSMALAGVLVAGPVADRLLAYRPGRVMAAVGGLLALYAVSVVVLAVSPWLWLSVVAGLPLEFGFVAIGPALHTLISLVVPGRIRGIGLQTIAPWQLLGLVALPFLGQAADAWGLRTGLLVFAPLFVVGAAILLSSTYGVDRDIRAARAASLAEQHERQARTRGRRKLVICRDVDVAYDSAQVLFHVDVDVDEGEAVAVLGTNGAGKSSLLRAIAGVHEAANGAIFVDGHDVTHAPADEIARRGVALVPSDRGVFADLTVADNLRVAHRGSADAPAATDAIAWVGELFPVLRQRAGQPAGTLSGGEQRMLVLAQALLQRPRLLLVDELSLGLAPSAVDALIAALQRVNAAGTTVVCVDQSPAVASRLADRAVFLDHGEVGYDGPLAGLQARPDLLRSVLLTRAAPAGRLGGGDQPRARRPAARASERPPAPAAARAGGQPRLRVADLTVRFGGVQALDGAHLEVGGHEAVGLIGPNGAGKTTLLDTISGFVTPDDGAIVLDGDDLAGVPPDARARRGLGRSFQHARLFPALTVRECVAVALERHLTARSAVGAAVGSQRVRRAERATRRRADELIGVMGLTAAADKRISELSMGLRRTVDLACAMAAEPRVLLLDEPSAGLAHAEAVELAPLITRLVRETGCGVVLVDHDLEVVTAVATRLVALDLGQVVASGPPGQVLDEAAVRTASVAAADVDADAHGPAGPGLAATREVQ